MRGKNEADAVAEFSSLDYLYTKRQEAIASQDVVAEKEARDKFSEATYHAKGISTGFLTEQGQGENPSLKYSYPSAG